MNFINWLITSSADPSKTSLALKGALSIGVAYALQALPVICGLHLICLSVDGNVLATAVNTTANIVYLALSIVGAGMFLYGLGRKLWLGRWSAAPELAPLNVPTDFAA